MDETLPNPLEQLAVEQLRSRSSAKWQVFGPEVLPLWVAEMDVPLAEPVAEALRRISETGDTGYPAGRQYQEAMIGFAAARWDWSPELSAVRTVPDVMRGVVEALKLVTEPGDAVVVSSPVYPPFFMYPTTAGRRVVEAPLGGDGRLDHAALEQAFEETTAAAGPQGGVAYLLCNPHNPTGTVHTAAELRQLAELAARYGVRVIADEIHAPLVLPAQQDGGPSGPGFTPYLSVDPLAFSLMSASKAWNLAGLKAGLLIAGEESTADLRRLPKETAHGPSHVGVQVQTAAYEQGGPWLDALLRGLGRNRRLLGELLQRHLPEISWRSPEATYLAWLDFSAYELPLISEDAPTPGRESPLRGPAKHLLQNAGVALTAGHPFGRGGERHARLNFATSSEILTAAVTHMGEALARR